MFFMLKADFMFSTGVSGRRNDSWETISIIPFVIHRTLAVVEAHQWSYMVHDQEDQFYLSLTELTDFSS